MNKKLGSLIKINGKLEKPPEKPKIKCQHTSYTKIEENGEKFYRCNDCNAEFR